MKVPIVGTPHLGVVCPSKTLSLLITVPCHQAAPHYATLLHLRGTLFSLMPAQGRCSVSPCSSHCWCFLSYPAMHTHASWPFLPVKPSFVCTYAGDIVPCVRVQTFSYNFLPVPSPSALCWYIYTVTYCTCLKILHKCPLVHKESRGTSSLS
jgi:hypothetical protein